MEEDGKLTVFAIAGTEWVERGSENWESGCGKSFGI